MAGMPKVVANDYDELRAEIELKYSENIRSKMEM
jgi:hypothetical protein